MKDKVVVITGASRGLGEALAELLAHKGAHVVASARDTKELETVARSIGGLAITADVTKESDMQACAAQAVEHFGHIDIWINNAGIWMPRGPIKDADLARARQLIEVNLFGTVNGSRAVMPIMKKQGSGMIVNIVSTSALQPRPMQAMYSASKHAEKGFTDALREEVRPDGITVVGVYPGGIKTELFNAQKPDDYDEFMTKESVAEKIVANLERESPETEQVIRRPGQK